MRNTTLEKPAVQTQTDSLFMHTIEYSLKAVAGAWPQIQSPAGGKCGTGLGPRYCFSSCHLFYFSVYGECSTIRYSRLELEPEVFGKMCTTTKADETSPK